MSEEATALVQFIDPDKLAEDLKIDIGNISEAMARQTSLFVYYASQAVKARRQFERWKTMLEILEAQLDARFRKELVTEDVDPKGKTTVKKPTEPAILAAIHDHPKWKAVSSKVIDAQEIYKLIDVAERAFEHRREMLKQIAQNQAREQDGQLRLLNNQTNHEKAQGLLDRMRERASAG